MVRLFVALDFPPGVRERLREPQAILKKSSARLSLVDPSIIHMTLKFIGEVSAEQADQIRESLRTLSYGSFGITIAGIGANNSRQPRVIWCTVSDGGKSAGLHDLIETALVPWGIPRDDRPFRPHATLARVRQYDPSLLARMQEIPRKDYGSFTVQAWQLKKSTLTPQGPLYDTILEVPCV